MKNSFNADFYVTAATMIPVLYLALAVQGSTLNAALTWLYEAKASKRHTAERVAELNEEINRTYGTGAGSITATSPPVITVAFLVVLALGVSLIFSVVGEFTAIRLLYYRQASSWQGQLVLYSAIILTAMIALVTVGMAMTTRRRFQGLADEEIVRRHIRRNSD